MPLPLLGVVVQVTMLEFIAHVVIEQKYVNTHSGRSAMDGHCSDDMCTTVPFVCRCRYRNPHPKPIEAIYTFPLDSQSVLRSFNVEMDGRKLYSQVRYVQRLLPARTQPAGDH